jgi:predicted transcriptional regulator
MTAIQLRISDALAQKVRELAEHDGVSMEQFVSSAVAEKLSGWTDESLQKRMARASREQFVKALDQVPDVPADENDRL